MTNRSKRKLSFKKVIVSWKKIENPAHSVFDVSSVCVTTEGRDLIGKKKWSDDQWIDNALTLYNKQKNTKLTKETVKDLDVLFI